MERVVFERMAELDQDHWWFLARRRILAAAVKRVVRPPTGAQLLEVGCGTGHNLAMLQEFGRVDACEMDPVARDLAGLRLGKPVIDARLPDLSEVPEGQYDVIALLDVLEHVEHDVDALKGIRTRLKPTGALVLTVPANRWMWSAHDVAHHHYRRYSKATLEQVFVAAGFKAQWYSHFNSLLFLPIAVARLAGKLFGSKASDDALPGARINAALKWIFGLEAGLAGRVKMPVGVSLIAVLRPAQA
ncbi:MAG: class I SAM-dependent methyltransferase [Sphingomicrobium sp.]